MIGVNESSAHITALQEKEQNELQESLPEIDQPTGLPTKQEKAKVAKGSKITKDNAKDLETKPKTKENPKDKIHLESQIDTNKATPIQKQRNNIIDKVKGFFSRLFGSGTVSQNVEGISSDVPRPGLPLKDYWYDGKTNYKSYLTGGFLRSLEFKMKTGQNVHGGLDMTYPNYYNWRLDPIPVYATHDGRVSLQRINAFDLPTNAVYIDSNQGVRTLYAHMQTNLLVQEGQSVETGDVIGYIGDVGTTNYHLHYEVQYYSTEDYGSLSGVPAYFSKGANNTIWKSIDLIPEHSIIGDNAVEIADKNIKIPNDLIKALNAYPTKDINLIKYLTHTPSR
jgi:murein DD-endopeptidase MepM/ murein hydrolase activator NlpD